MPIFIFMVSPHFDAIFFWFTVCGIHKLYTNFLYQFLCTN